MPAVVSLCGSFTLVSTTTKFLLFDLLWLTHTNLQTLSRFHSTLNLLSRQLRHFRSLRIHAHVYASGLFPVRWTSRSDCSRDGNTKRTEVLWHGDGRRGVYYGIYDDLGLLDGAGDTHRFVVYPLLSHLVLPH